MSNRSEERARQPALAAATGGIGVQVDPARVDPARVGIVLAAGASRRMGTAKALLVLDGRPLLHHHLDALATCCGRLRVVSGAHRDAIAAALPAAPAAWGPASLEHLHNPDWAHTHLRESLLLALHDLPPDAPVLITPVDAPPASPAVLDALLDQGPPAVPRHAGQDGHPVLARAGRLRAGLGADTLRAAMTSAPRAEVDDPDVLRNLNRPDDWEAWTATRSRPS